MSPLIKNYLAEDATAQYYIARQGSADNKTLKSGAAAVDGLGVVCLPGTASAGDRVDVTMMGESEVLCGSNIAAGRSFTSDAHGKAVLAITGQRAIGVVSEAGAADRIVRCLVVPHAAA